ncbi:MAG: PKD domain-containing protein, partial [Flavobacteriia bacterium]|nr:PKD domain-containing protein [Flavobacteriia bacterium]
GDNCGSVQFNIVTSPPSFTYLWNFGDGNTLTTTSNTPPSHTYSSPGTYHVTCTATPWLSNHNATNNFGEDCTFIDEFDIVISDEYCHCGVDQIITNDITAAVTFTNQVLYFPNSINISNLSINGDIIFEKCELKMAPGVSITLGANTKLKLRGSHVYSCDEMWEGFILKDKATFTASPSTDVNPNNVKTTLIEDAKIALFWSGLGQDNTVNITNTSFNKNRIGLQFELYDYNSATMNFITLNNSLFTCRDIPFVENSLIWPNTISVKYSTVPLTTSQLQTKYINNTMYSESNNATLKAPFVNQKSKYHILLNAMGKTLNYESNTPTYNYFSIGNNVNNQFNLFDNMEYGIYADNSNFQLQNCIFQNTYKGAGIYTQSNFTTPSNSIKKLNAIKILPNNSNTNTKFYNCSNAIELKDNMFVDISNVDIRNASPKNGIKIQSSFYKSIAVTNSNLYNLNNGILFTGTVSTTPLVFNGQNIYQLRGQVTISNNWLRANYINENLANRELKNAILVNNILPGNLAIKTVNSIFVNSNHIFDAYRGIEAKNWYQKNLQILSNTIYLKQDPALNNPQQYGISNLNNLGLSSNINLIRFNEITGYSRTVNMNQSCIYNSMSNNQSIECNNVTNSFNGIKFEDNNLGTKFLRNTMGEHYYGMVISQLNGTIGVQGSSISASSNKWTGTLYDNVNSFKTATLLGASAQNSKMYIKSNPWMYNPNGSGYVDNYGTSNVDNYFHNSTSLISTLLYSTGNNTFCSLINQNETLLSDVAVLIEDMEKSIQNHNENINQNLESKAINEHKIYRLLHFFPELREQSQMLDEYYMEKIVENQGKSLIAESQILDGQNYDAQIELSNISDSNLVDSNLKNVLNWYLIHSQDSTLSVQDSLLLNDLANLCPFIYGAHVYQARSLCNKFFNNSEGFVDNCQMNRGNMKMSSNSNIIKNQMIEDDSEIFIYPNPNTGRFYLKIDEYSQIEIYTLLGQKIDYEIIKIYPGFFELNMKASKGQYFLKIQTKDNLEQIFKLDVN